MKSICAILTILSFLTADGWSQTTPFFPFTDDFENGAVDDDDPVSHVAGGLPATLTVDGGNLILTEPFQLGGFSLGLTNVTKGGKLVHAGDASAKALVRLSDALAFAGLYTRGQTGENGGDGGAYFGNIRGDGLITTGSFTGLRQTLQTPLDPVTTDVVLQFDTIGTHVITTAWAADNPAAKYSATFVDTLARPAGFMGLAVGRNADDATGVSATFRSFQVLEPVIGDLNGDRLVNAFDIDGFIAALINPDGFLQEAGISPLLGDINGDGLINAFDIEPFVDLVTGSAQESKPQVLQQLAALYSPDSDTDGDGTTNANELLEGTNPNDAADFLHVTRIVKTTGGIELEWASVAGRRYNIQFSQSAEPGSWSVINRESIEAEASISSIVIPTPPGPQAFFRAVLRP